MELRSASARRPRVDRREAARILKCSRDNVRRLDKEGQLKSSKKDRNGAYTYDRREIEDLARLRGLDVKPGGELAARVFALFKSRKRFEDIVIETQQEPETIRALWRQYQAGFELAETDGDAETSEARAQREHDEQMRAMDLELERRRRGVLFAGSDRERPGVKKGAAADSVDHSDRGHIADGAVVR